MKKFLLSFLLATSVFAQGDPPPYVKGQSASGLGNLGSTIQVPKNQSTKLNSYQARIETGNPNELRNPSFEGSPYNSGWTCPTGTISQAVGPDGFKALGIVSSGAGFECNQTFTSTADLKGTLARFFARVKTSAPNTFVCGLDGGSAAGNRVNCQKVSLTNADKVFSETSGFFNYGNMVYGIAIYSTDTAAFPTVIDDVSMGAAGLTTTTIGSDITNWESYTPIISNLGTGGVASSYGKWRRVGDSIEILYNWTKDASGGSGASGIAVSLPSGIIADGSKVPNGGNIMTGEAYSSLTIPLIQIVEVSQSTLQLINSSTASAVLGSSASAGSNWRGYAKVPVQGWSAYSTSAILSSNADTNWTNFTPTGGWTTNTTYTGKYKYVGDSAVIQLKVATSGAPGGNTALSMDMPALIGVIDTAKLVGQNVTTNSGNLIDTGSATYDVRAIAPNNNIITFYSSVSNISKTYPMTWTAGDYMEVTFTVPIVGRTQSPLAIIPLYSPLVHARAFAGSNVSVTSAVIPMLNIVEDATGIFSNAATLITATIKQAGLYNICFYVSTDVSNNVGIVISGTIYQFDNFGTNARGGGCWVQRLAAGNTVRPYLPTSGTMYGGVDDNGFSVTRLGD